MSDETTDFSTLGDSVPFDLSKQQHVCVLKSHPVLGFHCMGCDKQYQIAVDPFTGHVIAVAAP